MEFKSVTTSYFDKRFSKLTSKNLAFKRQIINKLKSIRQNPEIGEPKVHELRGLRSLHISEHFVVVYLIYKNLIIFINLDHHDKAYNSRTTKNLIERLSEDKSTITALNKLEISKDDFAGFLSLLGKHK